MEQLFLKILNLSLYAGLLILAVLLLRVLFRKAPKWISCLFWALVAIRLLCPVTIESPFSVMPSAEKLPTANLVVTEVAIKPAAEFLSEAQNADMDSVAGYTGAEKTVGTSVVTEAYKTAGVDKTTANTTANSAAKADAADPVRVLTFIWLAGFCVMMAQALFSYLRLKHYVAASVKTGRNVRICDEIQYPFILGMIRPMIYLPGYLKGSMKRFVLAHERAHLKRRDHLWKPLGFFLLAVHWFNPLCWIAYILFSRDLEMACDERVIRNMDRESKADYSQTLLLLSNPTVRIAACPVAFGEIGVKERVKGIFNYKKPAVWIILLAFVGCIVLTVCFLTSPGKADTAAEQENLIVDTGNKDAALTESEAAVTESVENTEAAAGTDVDAKAVTVEPLPINEAIVGDVVYSADIDENGEDDYIYSHLLEEDEKSEDDDTSIIWTLELNGKNVYQSSHELVCDFDAASMDLDEDGEAEIFVRVMPHVNSMPLEEYVTLKHEGDAWSVLQNTSDLGRPDENGDLSNAFPVMVIKGSEPATVDISTVDGKTITVDLKKHYEKMMETEEGTDLYTLADEFLNGNTYKPGDQFGTTAAWGIWEIEGVKLGDEDAIRARQGIQSLKGGKLDVLGTLDTYFSYDQSGEIKVLKTEFTPAED